MVDFQCQQLRNRPICNERRSPLTEITWWCCLTCLLLGLVLAYAWFHNQIMDVNYQIEKLQNENARLREANVELRAEQARLMTPERIDQQARRLGLVTPDQGQVMILHARYIEVPNKAMVAEAAYVRKPLDE
ncbi:MAG TPA: septum formation initiator family protein [Acidobacteriota bacterium]|mgnify:CR=1 FL=1|nr:septum formation initiator family protein [Acidobacteriota bacterium]